jgi:transposase
MLENSASVTGGVDTHLDTHTAVALDGLGRLLGHSTFPATRPGFAALLNWLRSHGGVDAVGIEGTGSYGAGLARYLRAQQVPVIEVDRPDRKARRRNGKSDPADAEAAARAIQARTATGVPKTRDGVVESIRALRVVRRGAIKAHTAASNALMHLVITAADPLRQQLAGLKGTSLIEACAHLRPHEPLADPVQATKRSLRRIARRCQHLAREIAEADQDLQELITQAAPELLDQYGVGVDVAGQLLVTAGDNPDRLRSEASFAALCGTSPVSASSGRTDRHRLNRGGDRDANCALYWVVLVRMSHHRPTRDYVERRRGQGLTTKEIMRCLKRYVARELLPVIRRALVEDVSTPAPGQPETVATAA